MLFHSSPELAETVAAERKSGIYNMCNSSLDFVLSARGSRELLQLTQHSTLGNSMTLPMSSEILLLNARCTEPLFRPLRDVSVRCFT
jgi:hypothetical protein